MQDQTKSPEKEKNLDETINQVLADLSKLQSQIEDSENLDYIRKRANLYAELGILYSQVNNINKARDYLMAALRDFIKLDDKVAIASTKSSIGSIYLTNGDYITAKSFFSEAYSFWNEAPYLNERIAALNSLGICELNLGNEDSGVEKVLKAISIAAKLRDDAEFLFSIEILLRYFEEKKNYDVLRELKYKALEYWSQDSKFILRKYKTLIDIGVLSQILDDYTTALKNFKEAFNISLEIGDFKRAYLAQGFIAETFVSLKEIEKAKETYLNAYMIALLIDLESNKEDTEEAEQMKAALIMLGVSPEIIHEKKKEALEEKKKLKKELEDAKKKSE